MSSTSAPQDPQASQSWIDKAQALLDSPQLNLADAQAWPRDAAKAGAPLSREPLAALRSRLAERVQAIEDLQHRAQVEREAAVLLVQRIESLSTKPWREAQAGSESLGADVARWQAEAGALFQAKEWPSVAQGAEAGGAPAGAGARIAAQLEASRAQLGLVWEAFGAALAQARVAAEDTSAPLPQVPVWAEELKQARGEGASGGAGGAAPSAPTVVAAPSSAAQARQNDPARLELINKAEALLQGEGGAALAGRKLQEALRDLREQWKKLDLSVGAPHPLLWKRFDEACSAAHKVVQVWLDKLKAESAEHKAKRLALIDELKQWVAAHGVAQASDAPVAEDTKTDWKAYNRELHQFGERWREAGHLSEKTFAELLSRWKAVWDAAHAPLARAQKAGLQRRQALVEEAKQLSAAHAAGAPLRIDDVKALQQRWQVEAQAMPLDRRQEQKLWEAFRKPIDDAFALDAERRPARRGERGDRPSRGPGEGPGERSAPRQAVNPESMTPYDRAVYEAAQALHAASASGDAQAIHAAMSALEAARRADPKAVAMASTASTSAAADSAKDATASAAAGDGAQDTPAPAPAAPRKPVVAVRGDDRPGMRKSEPAAPLGRGERGGRPGATQGRDERGRGPRDAARGGPGSSTMQPRLGDAAFRAQRDALEHAQAALKKLAVQAHGEALTKVLDAWSQRSAEQLPSAQELGRAVSSGTRALWSQALASAAQGDGAETLLRLEMAAEVPTPADHLPARRALQLQLLTRRNDPPPAQTWGQDVARVLATPHTPDAARRLQQALKALLRG
ncbi:DUF349 domain-containing protein [Hylemonella sp. W303a]|uniref:DUF349 domain-containing protein n=1 Tax=Hylemonella sp. W303a TaxID=3389873 RepID=UPI00396AF90C